MKKSLNYSIVLVLGVVSLMACENEGYHYQDTLARINLYEKIIGSYNAIFQVDSLPLFSFGRYNDEVTEDTVYFTAWITGRATRENREFVLEAVTELTTVSASDYKIGTTVIPAGEFSAKVPIILQRKVTGIDLTDVENGAKAHLTLRHVPNTHFLSGALTEFNITWCDYLTKPASWSVMITAQIGPFSKARYRFYIDFTGEMEFTKYGVLPNAQALLFALRKALEEYNALADLEGRPHYKDDDGTDLTF